ncbi:MAG: hypothetical protein IKI45_17380 [Oscillospiraceae bacterium]|nr:hypothetical protein [Oscillospiraceae bacterium]
MKEVIPDPMCSGFHGIYVGNKDTAPLPQSNVRYAELAAYLKEHNKLYEELSKEEKNKFGIYHDLI